MFLLLNNKVVSMRYQHVVSTQNMVRFKTWLMMTWVTFGSQNPLRLGSVKKMPRFLVQFEAKQNHT